MRYHLFQKFFGKMVKIKKTSFLPTSVKTETITTVMSTSYRPTYYI